MTNNTAWVGKCLVHTQPIADEPHEHPWNAECYAAVWTDTKPHFEQSLREHFCLLYTSPSPRDGLLSRMPSSA